MHNFQNSRFEGVVTIEYITEGIKQQRMTVWSNTLIYYLVREVMRMLPVKPLNSDCKGSLFE